MCAWLRGGGSWRPFYSDKGWERHHELEYFDGKRFFGDCQVCKAENVFVHKLSKDDFVAKYFGLTEEANLVCSECWVKAKVHDPYKDEFKIKFTYQKAFSRGGKSQETGRGRGIPKSSNQKSAVYHVQKTESRQSLPGISRPKTMLNEPTIFVWDQYDIYLRKQLMISTDGTRKEIPNEDWKKLQTPNGQLGSAWNCHLWTGLYHEFPKALDLATYVRDHWGVDVEIIRNAGNAMIMVIALFDIRKFEKLSIEIKTYLKEKMGDI